MPEPSSLPLFGVNVDPGPSFFDLLRHVAPHHLPGVAGDVVGAASLDIPHGTTVLAIRFAGSVHARNWVKAGWRDDLDVDRAVELGLAALFAAADEDVATGGPDLVRKIYPSVAVIDTNGYRALDDDQVEERSRALLTGPELG